MKTDFLKSRLPLLLVLLAFIVLKYPHLYSSFYWDESWPYASAVYKMYQNGASLLPGAIDGILSRGHPLLFHYLGALWMYVFGDSIFALHCYALSISLLVLVSIYEISMRLFGLRVAIFALILVAFQEIFFVQAAFVLPEILVALLVLLSLYFYAAEKFVWTAISLSLLFLTKESGIMLGIVFCGDALLHIIRRNEAKKQLLRRCVALAIPFVVILAFFLLQKQISGWYVLPLYSEGIDNNFGSLLYKYSVCLEVVFYHDTRSYLYLMLFALGIIVALKQKRLKPLLPLGIGFLIFMFTDRRSSKLIEAIPLLIIMAAYFIWAVYSLSKLVLADNKRATKFVMLGVVFSICFFAFSASLFIINRYLFPAMIPLFMITALFFDYYAQQIASRLYFVLLLLLIGIQAYTFYDSKSLGDSEIGAFDAIKVHEDVVRFLEKNQFQNESIGAGGYLELIHLTDSNTKYLKQGKVFEKVSWNMDSSTNVFIFDNIEDDYRYKDYQNSKDYKLIYRTDRGAAWAEIYKRKK